MNAKPATTAPAVVDAETREVGALAVPDTAGDLIRRVGAVESLWDDLDDLDMIPDASSRVPFIRANGNIDGGLFVDDQRVDEVLCVIAARSRSRAKFEKPWDEDKNARPICWSSNGIVPDDNVPQRQSDKCATCPMSFEHTPEDQRKRACRSNIELLAYVPDTSDIAIMRFRIGGISVKHAMRYWASFSTRIPKKHPIGFVTRVTMEPESTPNGNKLAVHFERVKELSRDEVEVFIVDAKRRKAMWQQMIAEDVIDTNAQAGDGIDLTGPFDDTPAAASDRTVDPSTGEIRTGNGYPAGEEPF